jgi:hypothetical protein
VGQNGEPLWRSWLDAGLDLARVGTVQAYTAIGMFSARLVDELPDPLRVGVGVGDAAAGELEERLVPVLPLLEVEAAHPRLADVLARLRHRRTVAA